MNTPTAAPLACAHCGAPVPQPLASGPGPWFCCHGCRSVYALLHDQGLADYYRMRDDQGVLRPDALLPAAGVSDDSDALFRDPQLCADLLRQREDGLHECRLFVEGMHCAACVWLLEQGPRLLPGLHGMRTQFTRNAVDVLFDPQHTDLSQVAALIRRLGYRPHPWTGADEQQRAQAERRRWTLRFAIAGASMMATMHLAVNLFAGDITGDLDPGGRQFMGWLSFITALPAVTWCAWPYHRGAMGALRARRATLDLTVSLVLWSGFAISTGHLLLGRHDVYFDAMAMFIFFLLAGRLVYIHARDRVMGDGAALQAILPRQAKRVQHETIQVVAAQSLQVGDRIALSAGDRIAADGILRSGGLDIDGAILSGESMPRHHGLGATVHAGTTVVAGSGEVEVTASGAHTRMGRMVAALANGQATSSPIANLVDSILRWFAPLVLVLAVATFALWWTVDPSRSWEQTIAVIIVACPCALGLAAPLVQALTVSRAARRGILLRDAAVSERIAHCRHAVIDKTGTLTSGLMSVDQLHWLQATGAERYAIAIGSLAATSNHPASRALRYLAPSQQRLTVSQLEEIPGSGTRGEVAGLHIAIGKASWIGATGSTHGTQVWIAIDGQPIAWASLRDPLRPQAHDLIRDLRRAGMIIHCASGDHPTAVAQVAEELGLDPSQCQGDCSPEGKQALVQQLQGSGAVLMIGDGINDAAALSQAEVGIGIRGGLEAALMVSPVFLVRGDLGLIGELLRGSRGARRTLRWCLAWSLLYNVVGVGAAMAGWWGPWLCAIAMPASSLTIIAIALSGRAYRTASGPAVHPENDYAHAA